MITGKPRRAISKWPRIYSFFWFPHLPVLFFTLSPLSSTTLFFHLVFFSVLSTSSSQSSSPPSFSSLCFYRCRMFPQISPHSLAVISFLSHVFFSSLLALASFFPPILISFFLFHLIRPLFRLPPPVSRILKHQRSQRAVKPPADPTHNSPLLIMRTLGAHGAEFKRWKQQLEEVYESVLVRRWKWEFGAWCWRQLSVFLWCKNLFESFSW